MPLVELTDDEYTRVLEQRRQNAIFDQFPATIDDYIQLDRLSKVRNQQDIELERAVQDTPSNKLCLQLEVPDDEPFFFRIYKTDTFLKLKYTLAAKNDLNPNEFRMEFLGSAVRDNDTPMGLGMKHGDVINVYPEDEGGDEEWEESEDCWNWERYFSTFLAFFLVILILSSSLETL